MRTLNRTSKKASLQNKKVLLGTMEIANQMSSIAKGLHAKCINGRTLNYYQTYLNYADNFQLKDFKLPNTTPLKEKVIKSLIPNFDIFHFHFSTTLFPDLSDVEIINHMNKPMLMHHWGSEVRDLETAKAVNPYAKIKVSDFSPFKKKLEYLSTQIKYCVVPDHELLRYTKDYYQKTFIVPSMIDLQQYKPIIKEKNKKPLIVHAPTNAYIKGSSFIIEAIEKLKLEYDFDFQLVTGLSHEQAKAIYQKADLIIDQLHIGSYGLFAIESMAMGKPVICYISDYMKKNYRPDLPIISANPSNIYNVIKNTLNNLDALPEIGLKSRAYVEKNHDILKNIDRVIQIYKSIL